VAFPHDQQAALSELCAIISESLRLVPAAVATNDLGAAARLAPQKDRFRRIEDKVVSDHLSGAVCSPTSLRKSALFIDIVRDLHRTIPISPRPVIPQRLPDLDVVAETKTLSDQIWLARRRE